MEIASFPRQETAAPEIPLLGSNRIDVHDPSSNTESSLSEDISSETESENVLVDDSLIPEEPPIVGEIDDMCRGDDKFRCGTTSVFICEVQKCDGTKNCPDGEDEEECPTNILEESDESGEAPDEENVATDPEPEIETPAGDFLFYYFPNFMIFFTCLGVFPFSSL